MSKKDKPALAAVPAEAVAGAAAPAAAAPAAEKEVDRGPSADKLARDIALKAVKFGGVAALIGHYEFAPSRRVCKKAAEMLREGDALDHADALDAWSVEKYGSGHHGGNVANLRGRPMPVRGDTRTYSVQRIDAVEKDKDGKPVPGAQVTLGATFIRLNLAPCDVLKGGEVTATYLADGSVNVRVTRREPLPEEAPVAAAAE